MYRLGRNGPPRSMAARAAAAIARAPVSLPGSLSFFSASSSLLLISAPVEACACVAWVIVAFSWESWFVRSAIFWLAAGSLEGASVAAAAGGMLFAAVSSVAILASRSLSGFAGGAAARLATVCFSPSISALSAEISAELLLADDPPGNRPAYWMAPAPMSAIRPPTMPAAISPDVAPGRCCWSDVVRAHKSAVVLHQPGFGDAQRRRLRAPLSPIFSISAFPLRLPRTIPFRRRDGQSPPRRPRHERLSASDQS